MHMPGVRSVVISQWLGHTDPAFTMQTFMHAQNDALKDGCRYLADGCDTLVTARGTVSNMNSARPKSVIPASVLWFC